MNTPLSPVSGRLASLDILRGFDLFLLVFFQPVFVALGQRLNFPWLTFYISSIMSLGLVSGSGTL